MNIKHLALVAIATGIFILSACGGNPTEKTATNEGTAQPANAATVKKTTEEKGIGKYTHVELTHPLDAGLVSSGQRVYDVKCASCHKTTDEKLVGPGWKGVTKRRTPEWIMNFITNVDEMLDRDPASQAMLEECLVRMPNQNLSDEEARASLEFMRQVDGEN